MQLCGFLVQRCWSQAAVAHVDPWGRRALGAIRGRGIDLLRQSRAFTPCQRMKNAPLAPPPKSAATKTNTVAVHSARQLSAYGQRHGCKTGSFCQLSELPSPQNDTIGRFNNSNGTVMPFTIATWNINSLRLRANHVERFLNEEAPDILCLQETKSPVDQLPLERFAALGWRHYAARGGKGYNGVVVLSRLPIRDLGSIAFCGQNDARHLAVALEDGTVIHNVYVPAGGDLPDPDANPKFAHKLAFVDELRRVFAAARPRRTILLGDLNIAPREDDVWNHRALLDVVSHTPVETESLEAAREAGGFVDITRQDIPQGKIYSWWSYRSPNWDKADKGRRLDHIWASHDIAAAAHSSRLMRALRGWERPSDHVPVLATFDL